MMNRKQDINFINKYVLKSKISTGYFIITGFYFTFLSLVLLMTVVLAGTLKGRTKNKKNDETTKTAPLFIIEM